MKLPLINGFLASLKTSLNLLRLTVEKNFLTGKPLVTNMILIYILRTLNTFSTPIKREFNGILRRNGLPKSMDFREVNQTFISSVSNQRNHIPRKSLNYRTPIEIFLSYVQEAFYSSLI